MSSLEIKIQATHALTLYAFLHEFKEDMESRRDCDLLHQSFKDFENAVLEKVSDEQFEEFRKDTQIAILMGKAPDNAKSGSIFKNDKT